MYKDVPLQPGAEFVEDLTAVRNAIDLMLAYKPGQRLFNPQFGCDLEALLFEPMDAALTDFIMHELIVCLTSWDARIKVSIHKSSITPDYDNNSYDLSLVLEITGYVGTFSYERTLRRPLE